MYWKAEEDAEVEKHVKIHGEADWKKVAALLGRSANSCFLRWFNHLKPGLEHNDITDEEAIAIIRLHKEYGGNRWSKIARKLSETRPNKLKRTANKIKNFWNGTVKKKASELNLEVDTEDFVITMTNILRGGIPPTTTIAPPRPLEVSGGHSGGAPIPDFDANWHYGGPWDQIGHGADFIIDGVSPVNWEEYINW